MLRILKGNTARHSAWMISGAATQAITAFAANLVLVRLLLPEDFGRFAIVMANIGLVQAIVSIPIGTVVLRTPKEELNEKLSLYAAANVVQNLFCLVVSFPILFLSDKLDMKSILLLASVLSSNWISMQLNLYERRFQYKRLSFLETAAHLAGHLFAVSGALLGLGPIVLYGRELIRQLNLVLGLKYINGLQSIPLRWLTLKDWEYLFHQVRGFWLDGFLESSFGRFVILTVGVLAGETGAGYFFQAQRLAIIPHQFLQPITQRIAVNHFSHRTSGSDRVKLLARGLSVICALLGCAAMVMGLVAPFLIPVVFGAIWKPVVPILVSMLGFVVAATLFNLLKAYFVAGARMSTLILFGRAGQYLGFGSVALWAYIMDVSSSVVFGIGLSTAYILATFLLVVKLFLERKTMTI